MSGDRTYTSKDAKNALDAATGLIRNDQAIHLGQADHDAIDFTVGTALGTLQARPGGEYNREQVVAAVNVGAEIVLADEGLFPYECSVTIRRHTLVDLLVNAAGCLLDKPGMSLDEVMRENWQAEDPDGDAAEMVRGWLV